MFPFRKKKNRGQGVTAMVANDAGVAIACVVSLPDQPPILKYCDFIACDSTDQLADAIKQLSQQYQLATTPINTAILSGEFHLVMLEKPNVSEEELQNWRHAISLRYLTKINMVWRY